MTTRWLPAALLLASQSLSAAQTVVEIKPIIVTATRTAHTADETLASVTVFTRDQIEQRQAQSVQELLRGVTGLSISNNGGPGKATSFFLRGTESDHVLVLIDGVKIGSATQGAAALEHVPVDQIERIEVVRGPRSSLYGSEAIGGVIQIFTRRGGGRLTPYFTLGTGSYGTYDGSAGISGGGAHGWFNITASGLNDASFNACNGQPLVGGCFTVEPDKDGYRNLSGALRAGYQFTNGAEVGLQWLRAKGDSAFDGNFVNESQAEQQLAGGRVRLAPLDGWNVTVAAGRSWDVSHSYKDGVFKSRYDTQRDTVSLQNDIAIGTSQLVTVGLDYQNDSVDSTTAYMRSARRSTGGFAQYQGAFAGNDIQLALRRDDNAQFGNHSTGGVAWGYGFSQGLRLTASYGNAFKAPTFNELYYPGYGNADLRPETSQSLELGLSGNRGWLAWAMNAYRTEVDDLIAYDAASGAPANIDQARIRGLEATAGSRIKGWNVNTSLTLLATENRSSNNAGKVLPRRAGQTLRLDLDRDIGNRYRIGTTLFAEGMRYDDLANSRELGAYATVGLRAEYAIAKAWRLQGHVENLFDKAYETAAFYNQPGRSVYVTLRYRP